MRNLRPFVALAIVVIATACDGGLTEATIERKFKVYTGTDKVFIQIDQQLGFASATGVWTVEGDDKIADPINIRAPRTIPPFQRGQNPIQGC